MINGWSSVSDELMPGCFARMLLPDDLPTSHLHGYIATGPPRKGLLGLRLKERKLSDA